MSDKKIPPPRPPAPKLGSMKGGSRNRGKTNLPSVSIRYNPLSSLDDDDFILDDEISIVKDKKIQPTSVSNGRSVSQPSKRNTSETVPINAAKPPTKSAVPEQPRSASVPTKSRSFDRGLFTVNSEILEVKGEDTHTKFEGVKDAGTDPLTLLSKMWEEEDLSPPTSPLTRPRASSAKNGTLHTRAKSLDREVHVNTATDGLDLVSDHYDIPPSASDPYFFHTKIQQGYQEKTEPKEQSVKAESPKHTNSKKRNIGSISMSGLLAHSISLDGTESGRATDQSSEGDDSKIDSPSSERSSNGILDIQLEDIESPKETKPPITIVFTSAEPFPFIPGLLLTMLVYTYFTVPLPPYIQGMFLGFGIAFFLFSFFVWLIVPPTPREPMKLPDVSLLPQLKVPITNQKQKEDEKLLQRGWMNEIMKYDPTNYHISHTHSVFVRLEEYSLRLSRPKINIPRKASWDEPNHKAEFVNQRHFDLRGSEVVLLPEGLCRKRWWSKKYPICVKLKKKGTSAQKKVDSPTDGCVPLGDNMKSFDIITREDCEDDILHLFGRTGREKEEWFRKLELAANWDNNQGKKPLQTLLKDKPSTKIKVTEEPSTPSNDAPPLLEDIERINLKVGQDYYKYMSRLIPKDKEEVGQGVNVKAGGVTYASPARKTKTESTVNESPSWVNALIEEHIDLGIAMPVIRRTSKPVMDERGVWVDLDITYYGSCCMTLETKLNLTKLGKDTEAGEHTLSSSKISKSGRKGRRKYDGSSSSVKINTNKNDDDSYNTEHESLLLKSPPAALHSDEEDSAESSEEEDADVPEPGATEHVESSYSGSSTSKKILRIVDRIAKSKYFQKAAENSYVKKAIEEVSNLPLVLTVEVKGLHGTLAVNLPPPPSDRLWYGFRTKPHLWLSARPKLGMRQVTITHVTEWIEKKLEQEFQKVFVMPNMDDLVVPIMDGGLDESYDQNTETDQ
ncbi:testis-expressed protein 2-like [Saccoglossus kowalevskii]